jgi:DNA-binding beta-propeller fold protein YncE
VKRVKVKVTSAVWHTLRADMRILLAALGALAPATLCGQGKSCFATATSMTPARWQTTPPKVPPGAPRGALRVVQDYPLPGPANRFDYQSVDPAAGRLYLNHMNGGRLVVFDLKSPKVLAEVSGLPRATGVWAVPAHHKIFVSAAGNHEVAVIDDQTLSVAARVGGIRFPDGIAFAPGVDKVFVSDESGEADVVIDARTNAKRSTIALGGEAGNTHYDSVSQCILVAVQTRNQLVAIDPVTEKIVARYDLPGSDHPHGFTIDEPGRLAFITGEGNAKLLVLDLRTMEVIATHPVGNGPDVLAWDAEWRRLYVASEAGILSSFEAAGHELRRLGEYRAPHAHTVAVDPTTHRVYLPLENVNGRPVLRVMSP